MHDKPRIRIAAESSRVASWRRAIQARQIHDGLMKRMPVPYHPDTHATTKLNNTLGELVELQRERHPAYIYVERETTNVPRSLLELIGMVVLAVALTLGTIYLLPYLGG